MEVDAKDQNGHAELDPEMKEDMNGELTESVPKIVTDPSLVLFIVASILHGYIHGVVIGSFKDAKELLLVMIFVIIYKIPLSIAIGVAIINTGRKFCSPATILSGLLFILSTPAGIFCMMLIEEDMTFFKKTEPTILSI